MRSVDTNVLVVLIVRDDPRQTAAAETFVARGAWVSHVVLVELSWALGAVYDRKPREIAIAIDHLLDHEHVTVQDPEAVRLALATFDRNPAVGFSDCLIVEIARKAGHLPLGTFDRTLARVDDVERLG